MSPQYLAGFFDGEGCLRLHHEKHRCFRVRCHIGGTNLPVLVAIQDSYGGVLRSKRTHYNGICKQQYVLEWMGTDIVRRLLEIIRPHCIVKAAEIALILDEWVPEVKNRRKDRASRVTGGWLAADVVRLRQNMADRLADLKKVSFDDPPSRYAGRKLSPRARTE